MKILFVSSLYSSLSKAYLVDNCTHGASLLNQADAFQWAVLEGLVKNGADFRIVSFPALGTFPYHFKKWVVPASPITYADKCCGISSKYSALLVYKEWDIKKRLKKKVEEWIGEAKGNVAEPLVVLVYTSASMFIEPLVQLKSKYPNLYVCSIITDLIDDAMNFRSNRYLLKRIQIGLEKRKQKNLYKHIDCFVLLSKAMEEKIPESIGKNMVIEGIYSNYEQSQKEWNTSDDKRKMILYGGTLQNFAGVTDLVDAFMLLKDENYRLVICGSGGCESYIKECAKKDKRIDYKGFIQRDEFLSLQKNAVLLVNPRKPIDAITRFSFPSKTIEYLSSGVPMLGYKLEGIPEEYYGYYYAVDDFTVQGLADKLQMVLTLPEEERNMMAKRAYSFILQNKTGERQICKLLDFFKSKFA